MIHIVIVHTSDCSNRIGSELATGGRLSHAAVAQPGEQVGAGPPGLATVCAGPSAQRKPRFGPVINFGEKNVDPPAAAGPLPPCWDRLHPPPPQSTSHASRPLPIRFHHELGQLFPLSDVEGRRYIPRCVPARPQLESFPLKSLPLCLGWDPVWLRCEP